MEYPSERRAAAGRAATIALTDEKSAEHAAATWRTLVLEETSVLTRNLPTTLVAQ